MREVTAKEVEDLVMGNYTGDPDLDLWEEMEEVTGASRRWHTRVTTVFSSPELGFVSVKWDRANTEVQEHEFWAQVPKKVKKVPVTTYVWKEVSE